MFEHVLASRIYTSPQWLKSYWYIFSKMDPLGAVWPVTSDIQTNERRKVENRAVFYWTRNRNYWAYVQKTVSRRFVRKTLCQYRDKRFLRIFLLTAPHHGNFFQFLLLFAHFYSSWGVVSTLLWGHFQTSFHNVCKDSFSVQWQLSGVTRRAVGLLQVGLR